MTYIRTAFALNGQKTTIPFDETLDGLVSFDQGYTPDYVLPKTNPNAKNVEREKQNFLFGVLSSEIQQYQRFGTPLFITSADNGGDPFPYEAGARVKYDGSVWVSVVDDNEDIPGETSSWAIVQNSVTAGVTIVDVEAASPYQITADQTGYYFKNPSASVQTNFAAPVAPLDISPIYTIMNVSANGARFTCGAGETLRLGDQVTTAGGYIETLDVGASLTIVKISSTQWIVTSATGTWTPL